MQQFTVCAETFAEPHEASYCLDQLVLITVEMLSDARSHAGIMVCTETVAEAFDYMYYLEQAARVTVKALSTGQKLKLVDDKVQSLSQAAPHDFDDLLSAQRGLLRMRFKAHHLWVSSMVVQAWRLLSNVSRLKIMQNCLCLNTQACAGGQGLQGHF